MVRFLKKEPGGAKNLAEKLGVGRSTVYRWLKPQARYAAAPLRKLEELYEAHFPGTQPDRTDPQLPPKSDSPKGRLRPEARDPSHTEWTTMDQGKIQLPNAVTRRLVWLETAGEYRGFFGPTSGRCVVPLSDALREKIEAFWRSWEKQVETPDAPNLERLQLAAYLSEAWKIEIVEQGCAKIMRVMGPEGAWNRISNVRLFVVPNVFKIYPDYETSARELNEIALRFMPLLDKYADEARRDR